MTKEDFIKFASQGNSRVSVNKVIKNFEGSPLQVYKTLNNKNSFLFEFSGDNSRRYVFFLNSLEGLPEVSEFHGESLEKKRE